MVDLWDNRIRQIDLSQLRSEVDCPACKRGIFPWLSGERSGQGAVLCGRNAVQLSRPSGDGELDLDALAIKLAGVGTVSRNRYLLRLSVDVYQLTLFPDGRAIIGGTDDIAQARSVYARYVGA